VEEEREPCGRWWWGSRGVDTKRGRKMRGVFKLVAANQNNGTSDRMQLTLPEYKVIECSLHHVHRRNPFHCQAGLENSEIRLILIRRMYYVTISFP
jgi:hypothetical protein